MDPLKSWTDFGDCISVGWGFEKFGQGVGGLENRVGNGKIIFWCVRVT